MKATRPRLEKQLGAVFAVALFGAAIVAAVSKWEQLSAPSPERVVKIYRTHGCTCAFALADSLTAAGFEVRLIEQATLTGARRALHTPPHLRGCHVGEYLGYFLEGHVSPSALPELALKRSAALGLVTEGSANPDATHVSIAVDEQSLVLLVEPDGTKRPWFQPNDSSR